MIGSQCFWVTIFVVGFWEHFLLFERVLKLEGFSRRIYTGVYKNRATWFLGEMISNSNFFFNANPQIEGIFWRLLLIGFPRLPDGCPGVFLDRAYKQFLIFQGEIFTSIFWVHFLKNKYRYTQIGEIVNKKNFGTFF